MVILKAFATLLDIFLMCCIVKYSGPESKSAMIGCLIICFIILCNAILIWI